MAQGREFAPTAHRTLAALERMSSAAEGTLSESDIRSLSSVIRYSAPDSRMRLPPFRDEQDRDAALKALCHGRFFSTFASYRPTRGGGLSFLLTRLGPLDPVIARLDRYTNLAFLFVK